LPAGGHIRIVSPASPVLLFAPQRARRAEQALTNLGFKVSFGKHARAFAKETDLDAISAGTAQQRAEDLMAAFADSEVDAVFASLGGETSRRVLPHLDAAVFAGSPKPFIGHCDTAWINQYLLREAGLVSFYGATFMVTFGEAGGPFPEGVDNFLRAVMTSEDLVCRPVASRTNELPSWLQPREDTRLRKRTTAGGWTWLRAGAASGPAFCGELSMLAAMANQFSERLDGMILVWDVTPHSEEPFPETFARVAAEVDLSGIAGMIVGPDVRFSLEDWAEMVRVALDGVDTGTGPVVVNADVGHLDPTWVVPFGGTVQVQSPDDIVFKRSA
jgi:muramoyltetrapeptide carboxypeptidase LdcA involved in peptidoglycan recycling